MTRIARVASGLMGLAVLLGTVGTCGSRLPAVREWKRPLGQVSTGGGDATGVIATMDLTEVGFTDIDSGDAVSLDQYMSGNDLRFLLVVFGSRNCASCMREARELRDRVVGIHPLFKGANKAKFGFSLVNVDPQPPAAIKAWRDHAKVRLPFIRWSDPRARVMQSRFMPAGVSPGFPFQAMIYRGEKRSGILWYYTNKEVPSIETLVARVTRTVGGVNGPIGGGGDGGDGGDGVEPVDPGLLAKEDPARLSAVKVKDGAGATVDLGSLVAGADLRVVQIARGTCDATCEANRAELASACVTKTARVTDGSRATCRTVTLATEAARPGVIALDAPYIGGDAFFRVFATHFNWNWETEPELDPDTFMYVMPSVRGPLTLGFNAAGLLVFSHQGALTPGAVSTLLASGDLSVPARGPDFPFMDLEHGAFGFADARRQSRYTVVHTFGTDCGSCKTELTAWSAPGGLYDRCAAVPSVCQMAAVESNEPETDTAEALAAYMTAVSNWAGDNGVRVPMWIDTRLTGGDYTKDWVRFLRGYLTTYAGEPGYRTVIYDREGKIVRTFLLDETEGHAMEVYVDQLLQKNGGSR